MNSAYDTIAALLTPPGRGAVAVIRISGPKVLEVTERLARNGVKALKSPREQIYTAIYAFSTHDEPPEVLDYGLLTYFPRPHSFTGEAVSEWSLHGGPYLVSRFLRTLEVLGIRLARPGEFSERAFLNGQIDLSQAEAVADIIAAETEAQARVARAQLEGKLSSALAELGEPLRDLLAEIEASIDFPDEDIDPSTENEWEFTLGSAVANLSKYIDSFRTGRLYREGAEVVLSGIPNAGKSSLMNALAGENRVIVTPIPGTTRDSIEERVSIGGLLIKLWDTAGIVDAETSARTPDEIEQLGIERSWQRIRLSDLAIFLFDPTQEKATQEALYLRVKNVASRILVVSNKLDLQEPSLGNDPSNIPIDLAISARKGLAIDTLQRKLLELLAEKAPGRESLLVTTERHYLQLREARASLERSLAAIANHDGAECIALEIRAALHALNDIVGVTHTEDILGRIFSKFCIGK